MTKLNHKFNLKEDPLASEELPFYEVCDDPQLMDQSSMSESKSQMDKMVQIVDRHDRVVIEYDLKRVQSKFRSVEISSS